MAVGTYVHRTTVRTSSSVQKFASHVNSYSNVYMYIQVLRAQKFTFTRGTLAEMPAAWPTIKAREQLFSILGIGVWCMSRWSENLFKRAVRA